MMSVCVCVCMCVALGIQYAMRMRHVRHLRPARLYNIFPHYLIKGMIFEKKKLLNIQCVEIKCQLDATDDIYCRFYCMLNMFRAILCPSAGAREYYTDGRCLWYLVLWFSGCRYGVELKVMCPVCRLLLY